MTNELAKPKIATCNGLKGVAFTIRYCLTFQLDIWIKITRKVAKYHVHFFFKYAHPKFEVDISMGLGGEVLTIKYKFYH